MTAAVQLIFPQKCEGEMEISEIELRNAPLPESSEESDGANNDDDFNAYDPFYDLHKKSSDFAYEIQKHKMRYFSSLKLNKMPVALIDWMPLSTDLHFKMASLVNCARMRAKQIGLSISNEAFYRRYRIPCNVWILITRPKKPTYRVHAM